MNITEGRPTRLKIKTHEVRAENNRDIHAFDLHVPSNLSWFQGHFEEHPILPAVVQIYEALSMASTTWPDLGWLRRITRAKFRTPIRPGDDLLLRFTRVHGQETVNFEYLRNKIPCSSATLGFSSVEPDG